MQKYGKSKSMKIHEHDDLFLWELLWLATAPIFFVGVFGNLAGPLLQRPWGPFSASLDLHGDAWCVFHPWRWFRLSWEYGGNLQKTSKNIKKLTVSPTHQIGESHGYGSKLRHPGEHDQTLANGSSSIFIPPKDSTNMYERDERLTKTVGFFWSIHLQSTSINSWRFP